MGLASWGAVIFIIGMIMFPYTFFWGILVCLFGVVIIVVGFLAKGVGSVANVVHDRITKGICPHCKSKVPLDARICLVCGREISIGTEKVTVKEVPIKVNIIPESKIDKLESELNETIKLLDKLQKKMVMGDISEEIYIDLKNNFEDKKFKLKKEIEKENQEK